jgi:glutamyl-tRNA reductase
VGEAHLVETNHAVRAISGMEEAVILSTCNRTEIYVAHDGDATLESVERFIRERFELSADEQIEFYGHQGREAALHLFRVASGMDSMVLGETEIFGQVKKAYAAALDGGSTSRVLNRLFQQAFKIGKHVRTHSRITSGPTSVGAVAVDLAEKIFGELKKCTVMVIGAGEISRSTAQSLASRGATGMIVSNRSFDKAEELAREIGGRAIRFDDCYEMMPHVDIVVASTAAPHPIIHTEHVKTAIRKRRGRPLFMIDIAVPRDIDPAVGELDSVYLYDIDGLQQIAGEALKNREQQIAICDAMIDEQMKKLLDRGDSIDFEGSDGNHAVQTS